MDANAKLDMVSNCSHLSRAYHTYCITWANVWAEVKLQDDCHCSSLVILIPLITGWHAVLETTPARLLEFA